MTIIEYGKFSEKNMQRILWVHIKESFKLDEENFLKGGDISV